MTLFYCCTYNFISQQKSFNWYLLLKSSCIKFRVNRFFSIARQHIFYMHGNQFAVIDIPEILFLFNNSSDYVLYFFIYLYIFYLLSAKW